MIEKLTSRSAIETYLICQRKRWLANEIPIEITKDGKPNGYGLQKIRKSLDLIFGGTIHEGIEALLKGASIDTAIALAEANLQLAVDEGRVFDKDIEENSQEAFANSIEEHKAMTEALIYAWYLSEFKEIKENFQVILVEQELENTLGLYGRSNDIDHSLVDIILQSRVDCLLLDKRTSELLTYSLKTIKQTGFFSEMMMNRDLQGYLEIWATERWLEKIKQIATNICFNSPELPKPLRATIGKFLNKTLPLDLEKVDRVRFCFLVKGYRDKETKSYDNSFIWGYRKLNIDHSYSYAHSFEFYNPNNLSGEGRLGKGWERFAVWKEYEGGIRKWIDDIQSGEIQPEAKNPIAKIVSVPEPVIRQEFMLDLTIDSCLNLEREIIRKTEMEEPEKYFMPNHRSCTLPSECEFFDICYKPDVREDPLGSGLYQIRVNHHERTK